jgi:thiamine biosynthesis protein ThiC
VIDLSTGKDIDITREAIFGTVPIYQAVLMGGKFEELTTNAARTFDFGSVESAILAMGR